jgi:hypothetical protein
MKHRCLLVVAAVLSCLSFQTANSFQARDHLTPEEQDLVRDAQILDKRTDIFIKAVDRRLAVLNLGDASISKQLKKDAEKWGELPKGSTAELVRDIAKILDEAITNIDDVSMHDERNPLIAKSLRKLANEATLIVQKLKPLQAQAKGESELASFEELMENADSIVQAANRLPPPIDKKEKGKNEKAKNSN